MLERLLYTKGQEGLEVQVLLHVRSEEIWLLKNSKRWNPIRQKTCRLAFCENY